MNWIIDGVALSGLGLFVAGVYLAFGPPVALMASGVSMFVVAGLAARQYDGAINDTDK